MSVQAQKLRQLCLLPSHLTSVMMVLLLFFEFSTGVAWSRETWGTNTVVEVSLLPQCRARAVASRAPTTLHVWPSVHLDPHDRKVPSLSKNGRRWITGAGTHGRDVWGFSAIIV